MKQSKQFIKNTHNNKIKTSIEVNFSDDLLCGFSSFSNQLNLNSNFS